MGYRAGSPPIPQEPPVPDRSTKPTLRPISSLPRPTRAEAEAAVRTLLAWTGDNPERPGLVETPARVVRAFEEYFQGYQQDPTDHLRRTFDEVASYQDVVVVRDIRVESHCEHHLAPIVGHAHVAYLPGGRVVGLSKLARAVEALARRLQIQERLTAQIAEAIEESLAPRGVAVVVEAEHHCMTTRGVHRPGSLTVTRALRGAFREPGLRSEVLTMLAPSGRG